MSTWTPERENKLSVLWMQGLSCSQIASELNKLEGPSLTRNAVIGKRVRLGLPDRGEPSRMVKPRKPRVRRKVEKLVRVKRVEPKPPPEPARPRQIGAERGDWNLRYSEVMGLLVCKRFVAEESGLDGFVCARPIPIGSWCDNCKRDVFQPLKLASAA